MNFEIEPWAILQKIGFIFRIVIFSDKISKRMKIKFLIFPLAAKAWDDCPSNIGDYPSGFEDGWGHWYHLVDENYGVGTPIPVT